MKRLLHIVATPRGELSRTLSVSEVFLEAFQEGRDGWLVDELDLSKEDLPPLSLKSVSGKYVLLQGDDLFGSLKETWAEILQHIERFKTADFFLISTPMWNFSIPYLLKQYIDLIVQPNYLFFYNKEGKADGLVKGKKAVIITSRGGQYSGDQKAYDYQEPYLRTILQFIGFTDISFICADGMDMGEKIQEKSLRQARERAREMGKNA